MDYINATTLLEASAHARGVKSSRGDQATVISENDARLRLRQIPSGVILETTHGPSDSPETFWLDLYSDEVTSSALTLEDSIEYGLDLLLPNGPVPPQK